jgi:hypothetical protein
MPSHSMTVMNTSKLDFGNNSRRIAGRSAW